MCYHSREEEWGHYEEILDQSNIKTLQEKLQILTLYIQYLDSDFKGWKAPLLQLCYLQRSSPSWTGSILGRPLSLADVSQIWLLQHFGVASPTLTSPSQLFTMVCHGALPSQDLHLGNPIEHTVPVAL